MHIAFPYHLPNIKESKNAHIMISETCCLLFLGLMLLAKGLGLQEGSALYSVLLMISMCCFLGKLVLTPYSPTEGIITTLLLAFAAFLYLRTGERGIVFGIASMIVMKDMSLKKVFHCGARLLLGCFLLMMFLTQTGFLPDLYYIHDKGSLGYVVRWSFGYTHPNVLHITYLVLSALWMYELSGSRKKLRAGTLIFMLGNLYVLFFSLSYTGFLVETFYLLCNYFFAVRPLFSKRFPRLQKPVTILTEAVFPFCVLFSVAGPVILKGRAFELADKLTHHRFALSYSFLTTEPVCLFGHRLLTTPDLNNSIDCSYTYLFVHLGIVCFVLFCAAYFLAVHLCLKKGYAAATAILISFAIAGVTEPFLFNTSFKNITFLLMGSYLFQWTSSYNCKEKAVFSKISGNAVKKSGRPVSSRLSRIGKRELIFRLPDMQSALHRLKSDAAHHRFFVIAALLTAGVAALLVTLFVSIHTASYSSVLLPVRFCPDGFEKAPVTWQRNDIATLSRDRLVLSFQGSEEEMAEYTGVAPKLEYVRRMVCVFTWSLFFTLLLVGFVLPIIFFKNKIPAERKK